MSNHSINSVENGLSVVFFLSVIPFLVGCFFSWTGGIRRAGIKRVMLRDALFFFFLVRSDAESSLRTPAIGFPRDVLPVGTDTIERMSGLEVV
jgi:hypothetical protein